MNSCNFQILHKTRQGKLIRCATCDKIHVEFQNLQFTFTTQQFEDFKDYFQKLDTEYWESVNRNTPYTRKIMVPVGNQHLMAVFTAAEIDELRKLLSGNMHHKKLLNHKNIDVEINWN